MIHVDGQTIVVMESVTDRMRLKDKIVTNVAKAIKSIQELQAASKDSTVTLGNYDWQCHRLCEHLDHAFLHGLRHVTPGYWKMVSEFTHKDCIKEIKRMRHVTTDLGRGRAWLFMALNECLLESYIRCYQQNEKLVNKYYVNDALVRDHQRWNLILTLTSGLENTVFQLECDVPYLDLCVYPPDSRRHRAGTLEAAMEFDKLSLCSMDSVCLATSRPLAQAVVVRSSEGYSQGQRSDSDTNSTGSWDVNSSNHSNQRTSVDSGCHSDWNFRQRSITPIDVDKSSSETGSIDRLDSADSSKRLDSTGGSSGIHSEKGSIQRLESTGSYTEIVDTAEGELEIIRLPTHVKGHKHKKKKKKRHDESDKISKFDKNKFSIEIPPIDESKFEDTVMNYQNNNMESSSSDFSLSSDVRSPGDGHEESEQVTNGAIKSTTTHAKDDNVAGSVKDATNHSLNVNVDKQGPLKDYIVKSNKPKADKKSETAKNEGGSFQDMLKARVSNIADDVVKDKANACDNVDSPVKTIKMPCDADKSVQNTQSVQYDSVQNKPEISGVFKSGIDAINDEQRHVDPHLYSGSPVHDNDESELTVKQNIEEKVESIYGGPSIYSNEHDSNSETEELIVNHDSSVNNPVKEINKHPEMLTDKVKTLDQSSSKLQNNGFDALNIDPVVAANTDTNKATKTSVGLGHMTPSPRHTPSPTNQKLYSKLTNHSPSPSQSPNQMADTIKQSPNQIEGYRVSPNQRTDTESQRSDDSKSVCSTVSSDVELQGSELELKGRVDDLINKASADYHHLSFVEEDGDDDDIDLQEAMEEERERSRSLCDGEVELDNNSMLFLQLDILETDDTYIKMFGSRQGHTEGKTSVVFLLISTKTLYILTQTEGGKFSKEVTIPFLDIDFVSLGINNQLIHLVCKNRRKQHWFTTGDERVTIAIIDCLASSMEKSECKPAKLEVDTGAMTQKISLRKYVTKECRCEASEADILCYSLVHWEDPSATMGTGQSDREGNLLYKCNETANMLGYQTWRPAYAVLKDCMLCLYHDKNDPKPQHFLSMGGEQCVGCKRDFNSDRNHSIRIMLADGTYWSIALATEMDANDWIQALCQAVSEGLKMSPARTSNIPCCMILTRDKLLMCHEDVETSFVRTLGSANLVDITAVLNDELCNTYIVLAFDSVEANVSSEKWVLYFNSQHECERFIKALSHCWSTYFQIEVPVIPMDDFGLQKKCRDMAEYLHKQLGLK